MEFTAPLPDDMAHILEPHTHRPESIPDTGYSRCRTFLIQAALRAFFYTLSFLSATSDDAMKTMPQITR